MDVNKRVLPSTRKNKSKDSIKMIELDVILFVIFTEQLHFADQTVDFKAEKLPCKKREYNVLLCNVYIYF